MQDPEEMSWRELAEDPDPYHIDDPEVRHSIDLQGWVELGSLNYDEKQPAKASDPVQTATDETIEPTLFAKLRALHKTPEWAKERG